MLPENARVDSTLHVRGLVTGGVFFSYLLSRFEDEMLNGCCAYFCVSAGSTGFFLKKLPPSELLGTGHHQVYSSPKKGRKMAEFEDPR